MESSTGVTMGFTIKIFYRSHYLFLDSDYELLGGNRVSPANYESHDSADKVPRD